MNEKVQEYKEAVLRHVLTINLFWNFSNFFENTLYLM